MSHEISIVVKGIPVGKGRPRFNRKTGVAYTPTKTKKWEEMARYLAALEMKCRKPIDEPCEVIITAAFSIPNKWQRWKVNLAQRGLLAHTQRPDIDNVTKAALDAITPVLSDDSRVFRLITHKTYSDDPQVKIVVRPIGMPGSHLKTRPDKL